MSLGTNQQWHDLSDKRVKTRHSTRKVSNTPDQKACKDCGVIKRITEYHLVGGGRRRTRCKPCMAAHRFLLRAPKKAVNYRGEQHHACKLTDDDVRLILSLVEDREELYRKAKALSNSILAEKFDVSRATIEKIAAGIRWVA